MQQLKVLGRVTTCEMTGVKHSSQIRLEGGKSCWQVKVEEVSPEAAKLSWYPALRHFRQSRFVLLDLNSLCLSRIALANWTGPCLFLPWLEGKKSKKAGLQCLDDPTQSVQSHTIIIPTTVWKLQIMFIFTVDTWWHYQHSLCNISPSRSLSGSRLH